MRVALGIVGAYVASERTVPHPCHFEEARAGWAQMPYQLEHGVAFKLFGVWERWDACWYAKIATFGYATDGSTAFFPLYPAAMRLFALPFGAEAVVVSGMAVSAAALVLALWGLYRLVRLDHDREVAQRTMFLVAIFPAAFFLLAPFTESLFLALVVWTLHAGRTRRWPLALALGLLAGLTRPVGAFLALPLVWLAWRATRGRRPLERAAPLGAALAPAAGGAAFVAYTAEAVGRSSFDASAIWGSASFHWPWEVVAASLEWTLQRGDPLQALDLALLLLFVGLFVAGLTRLPLEQSLYAAPHLILVATRILPTPLTSTPRYLLVVFPAFVLLALLLQDRRARWSWAILSLLLLGLLAHAFARGDFVA